MEQWSDPGSGIKHPGSAALQSDIVEAETHSVSFPGHKSSELGISFVI
jgi:hypothetical protein